jgi:hypothetical protein
VAEESPPPRPLHARPGPVPSAPIVSRLLPILPPFAITGPETFHRFGYAKKSDSIHLSLRRSGEGLSGKHILSLITPKQTGGCQDREHRQISRRRRRLGPCRRHGDSSLSRRSARPGRRIIRRLWVEGGHSFRGRKIRPAVSAAAAPPV